MQDLDKCHKTLFKGKKINSKDFTYIGFKTSNMICTHCGHVFKSESIANKEKLSIKFKILSTFLGREEVLIWKWLEERTARNMLTKNYASAHSILTIDLYIYILCTFKTV